MKDNYVAMLHGRLLMSVLPVKEIDAVDDADKEVGETDGYFSGIVNGSYYENLWVEFCKCDCNNAAFRLGNRKC